MFRRGYVLECDICAVKLVDQRWMYARAQQVFNLGMWTLDIVGLVRAGIALHVIGRNYPVF